MAKYEYFGSGPCRVGMTEVKPGDIIDSDTNPGKRFRLIFDEPKTFPNEPAKPPRRKPDEPSVAEGAQ